MSNFLVESPVIPIQFTENFLNKLNLCLSDDNQGLLLIHASILQGKSLEEIAYDYNERCGYNNDVSICKYLTSTVSGLFDAFIHYKRGEDFDSMAGWYLNQRNGILGSYQIVDGLEDLLITNLTVMDLIRELDGEGFFIWLNNLSEQQIEEFHRFDDDCDEYYNQQQAQELSEQEQPESKPEQE